MGRSYHGKQLTQSLPPLTTKIFTENSCLTKKCTYGILCNLSFIYFFLSWVFSGKNVLGQKSELQRALEKHKRAQTQKEIEQQKISCRTPFERMIEERAKKIETVFF